MRMAIGPYTFMIQRYFYLLVTKEPTIPTSWYTLKKTFVRLSSTQGFGELELFQSLTVQVSYPAFQFQPTLSSFNDFSSRTVTAEVDA
jgi:hypothetical protein